MNLPREITLSADARAALGQIIGIMSDQVLAGEGRPRWEMEDLISLEVRLGVSSDSWAVPQEGDDATVTLGIDDAALLLDGMAFTEMASVEFSFFDMVQWTSDFVTGELRSHWSEDEWRAFAAR